MPEHEPSFGEFEATLKRSVAALRDAEIPFLLGGSLACWARGAPETRHDLDLMIREQWTPSGRSRRSRAPACVASARLRSGS